MKVSRVVFVVVLAWGCGAGVVWAASKSAKPAVSAGKSASIPGVKHRVGGTCNKLSEESTCTEFDPSGVKVNGVDWTKACGQQSGTWGKSPCPGDKLIGACVMDLSTEYFYGTGGMAHNADEAKGQCDTAKSTGTTRVATWKPARQ